MRFLSAVFWSFVVLPASALALDQSIEAKVRATLAHVNPQAVIDDVSASPVPGLVQVVASGEVVYVTEDGEHIFFQGGLYRASDRANLSAVAMGGVRARSMGSVRDEDAIIFKATNEQHVVTVFTDIDCGYCRMLHSHIDSYNAAGITVRYLAFPRTGPGTESWAKAEAVWCSADPKAALTAAKEGKAVSAESCESAVRRDFDLGVKIGVRATPAIFTADGREIGGFLDTQKMLEALKQR